MLLQKCFHKKEKKAALNAEMVIEKSTQASKSEA